MQRGLIVTNRQTTTNNDNKENLSCHLPQID